MEDLVNISKGDPVTKIRALFLEYFMNSTVSQEPSGLFHLISHHSSKQQMIETGRHKLTYNVLASPHT